jgi:hypothetical protein
MGSQLNVSQAFKWPLDFMVNSPKDLLRIHYHLSCTIQSWIQQPRLNIFFRSSGLFHLVSNGLKSDSNSSTPFRSVVDQFSLWCAELWLHRKDRSYIAFLIMFDVTLSPSSGQSVIFVLYLRECAHPHLRPRDRRWSSSVESNSKTHVIEWLCIAHITQENILYQKLDRSTGNLARTALKQDCLG